MNTTQPLTIHYLHAAAKALNLVQDHAKIRWADEDGNIRIAHLRGWASHEEDVRDRDVRTTSPTGGEDTVPFADLVEHTARYRVARTS